MPVYASTNGTRLLSKRRSLHQRSTTRANCLLTKQRNNALELHSRLVGEFHRQSKLQELDKKECYTAWFPLLSKQTDEQNPPQKLSTLRTNITHFKPIKKRVSSATEVGPKVICDRRYILDDSRLCRHFCELLGPNLCIDCTRLKERLDALRENEKPLASLHLERDPFTALVCSHYYDKECENDESDEEVIVSDLSDHEDLDLDAEILRKQSPVSKVYFSASPPGREDSGYSSRVSYIKDLTRPQSCASLLRSFPTTPSTPIRREKTRVRETRTQDSLVPLSPTREESLDVYGFTKTLEKLQKRKEVLGLDNKWPRERVNSPKVSWQKTPVEPILMELKLINFTQYDKLGYEPPPPEPEPPEPVIPTDEFGFPLMDALQISPS
ncbi:uncharacterized protein LOC116303642 [Actinia tenebrosa]|uniref:Uncharacterized protein LOC116303642 n=1 Tax=Actinia tenebrosa TaxID=6105 RepID=A0A6P8IQ91_ACTTE|nr:uncharacterized protein LOC116303642 [Actinia tenebrosa]